MQRMFLYEAGARARASYKNIISTIGTRLYPNGDQGGSENQEKPSKTALDMVLCADPTNSGIYIAQNLYFEHFVGACNAF